MVRVWLLAMGIGGLAMGGGSIASEAQWWRPAMPAVRIDVVEAGVPTPTLVLVYGQGRDPYRSALAGDQIASCQTLAGTCSVPQKPNAFQMAGVRRQSLQVRWLNDEGHSVIGGVVWDGPARPKQVTLRCDLSVADARKACSITDLRD